MSEPPATGRSDASPLPPPPATLSYASANLGREVRAIAVAQRQVIWTLLAATMFTIGWPFMAGPVVRHELFAFMILSPAVFLGLVGMMLMCVYRLSIALGQGPVLRVFYMLAMLVPFINIFALQSINHQATRALRRAGVRVGLMGAKLSDLP